MGNENVFAVMAREAAQQTAALKAEIITNAIDYFTADAEFCRRFEQAYSIHPDAWMAHDPEARREAAEFVERVNNHFMWYERFFPGFREEVLSRLDREVEEN